MKEALFYHTGTKQEVSCSLCCHRCTMQPGHRGICGVRENRQGVLYSLVYGTSISEAVDPIEKKPLFHFYPGSRSFSIATVGCNFRCLHCQNSSISQMPRDQKRIAGDALPPAAIVSLAQEYNCRCIAYTYTEPTIYFEYAYDTSRLAREASLANVFVTNGYIVVVALGVTSRTIEHLKKRFVEDGIEAALKRKPRERPPREVIFDGAFEARLIALRPGGGAAFSISFPVPEKASS